MPEIPRAARRSFRGARVPGVRGCVPPPPHPSRASCRRAVWPPDADVAATTSQRRLGLPSGGTLESHKRAGRLRRFTPRAPISDRAEPVLEVKAMNGRRCRHSRRRHIQDEGFCFFNTKVHIHKRQLRCTEGTSHPPQGHFSCQGPRFPITWKSHSVGVGGPLGAAALTSSSV